MDYFEYEGKRENLSTVLYIISVFGSQNTNSFCQLYAGVKDAEERGTDV